MFKIMQTIKNLIKLGSLIENKDVLFSVAQYLGKKQKYLRFVPYGLQINPPASNDIAILILNKEGEEDAWIGFESDMNNRDTLSASEVAIGIPTKTNRLKFNADGSITLTPDSCTPTGQGTLCGIAICPFSTLPQTGKIGV